MYTSRLVYTLFTDDCRGDVHGVDLIDKSARLPDSLTPCRALTSMPRRERGTLFTASYDYEEYPRTLFERSRNL